MRGTLEIFASQKFHSEACVADLRSEANEICKRLRKELIIGEQRMRSNTILMNLQAFRQGADKRFTVYSADYDS
jgi:hypothetical protein